MSGKGEKRNRPQKDTSFEEQEEEYRRSRIETGAAMGQEYMEEIRKMIREMQREIKGEMEMLRIEIRENLKTVGDDIRELGRQLKENKEEVEVIKREINGIKLADGKEKAEIVNKLGSVENRLESIERDKIRNNLVVSGIEVEDQGEEQIKKTMQEMLEKQLGIRVEIERATKINRQKCVIKIKEWRDKIRILTEKRKLRGGTIYIDSDLTKKQREVQKKIRDEAKKQRESGKAVKVGYNRLTVNNEIWVWNNELQSLSGPIGSKN